MGEGLQNFATPILIKEDLAFEETPRPALGFPEVPLGSDLDPDILYPAPAI